MSRWARVPPATRAVAQLVLLDGKFATMPGVVAEGRRVIANIERSANLFVTKTVYAILIAVFVAIVGLEVPVPAAPPHDREHVHDRHPRLLPRARAEQAAVRARVPRSCAAVHGPGRDRGRGRRRSRRSGSRSTCADLSLREARTSATLVLSAVGLWVLVCLARPFNWWRTLLVAAMVVSIVVILFVPALRNFYALQRARHRHRRRDGR